MTSRALDIKPTVLSEEETKLRKQQKFLKVPKFRIFQYNTVRKKTSYIRGKIASEKSNLMQSLVEIRHGMKTPTTWAGGRTLMITGHFFRTIRGPYKRRPSRFFTHFF